MSEENSTNIGCLSGGRFEELPELMEQVPVEIWFLIFSFLEPKKGREVTSILRISSTCKLWKEIITELFGAAIEKHRCKSVDEQVWEKVRGLQTPLFDEYFFSSADMNASQFAPIEGVHNRHDYHFSGYLYDVNFRESLESSDSSVECKVDEDLPVVDNVGTELEKPQHQKEQKSEEKKDDVNFTESLESSDLSVECKVDEDFLVVDNVGAELEKPQHQNEQKSEEKKFGNVGVCSGQWVELDLDVGVDCLLTNWFEDGSGDKKYLEENFENMEQKEIEDTISQFQKKILVTGMTNSGKTSVLWNIANGMNGCPGNKLPNHSYLIFIADLIICLLFLTPLLPNKRPPACSLHLLRIFLGMW